MTSPAAVRRPVVRTSVASRVPAPLVLQVARGRTRFPSRPICGTRFLIGSAEECDLQLGGLDIPELHSLLVRENDRLRLECLVPTPPVFVNGRQVSEAVLHVGDVIDIGPLRFILRDDEGPHGDGRSAAHPESQRRSKLAARTDESSTRSRLDGALVDEERNADGIADPSALTASELVDRIEDELDLVDEFDAGRRRGAAALIAAAFAHGTAARDAEEAGPERTLIAEMERLACELDRRNERLASRTGPYAQAAVVLLEAQEQLERRLDEVSAHLETLEERAPSRRASA